MLELEVIVLKFKSYVSTQFGSIPQISGGGSSFTKKMSYEEKSLVTVSTYSRRYCRIWHRRVAGAFVWAPKTTFVQSSCKPRIKDTFSPSLRCIGAHQGRLINNFQNDQLSLPFKFKLSFWSVIWTILFDNGMVLPSFFLTIVFGRQFFCFRHMLNIALDAFTST